MVLTFLGCQLTTPEEREELYQLFKSLNVKNDGVLSKAELQSGFSRMFPAEADELLSQVDSGSLEFNEFVTAAMSQECLLTQDKLAQVFRAFDLDDSGGISPSDLRSVLGRSSAHNESLLRALIREVDTNEDGEIDFEEFCRMMTVNTPEHK